MNKEELFQELAVKIGTGEISREEVINRFGLAQKVSENAGSVGKESTRFSMTKMLYVLGVAIMVIGIVIFVYQIWDEMGSLARVSITLGLGLLFTVIGSVLSKQKPDDKIGSIFHLIGGLLVPGGALVTISELKVDTITLWPFTLTFGMIFAFYLLLNLVHRSSILTFFAIANGTAFIYLFVESIIDGPFYRHGDLYAYLTMVVGASYLLLAHAFRNGWNRGLFGVLCFFGSAGFLGAGFSQVFDSDPWKMFYFLFVIGGLFVSAYMRSRSILVVSTLFLLAYVSYITGEYFADSIGWPVALVILGFIFIGLGYVSININKKYISQSVS